MSTASTHPSGGAASRAFDWPGHRILVVDDAVTVRLFSRQVLEGAGFAVEEAINGLEGLERLMAEPFDLILADVNMQKMDGHEMLRRVRADPALRAIPAIMMSTESKPEDVATAYAAGANHYLFKPIRPDRLVSCVRLMTATVM